MHSTQTDRPNSVEEGTRTVQHHCSPATNAQAPPGTANPEPLSTKPTINIPVKSSSFSTMNPPLAQNIRKLTNGTVVHNDIFPIPTTDNTGMTSSTLLSSASAPPASAALDLFILTFNCAKNLIDVPVFSAHLQGALGQNSRSAGLPDLVALYVGPPFVTLFL